METKHVGRHCFVIKPCSSADFQKKLEDFFGRHGDEIDRNPDDFKIKFNTVVKSDDSTMQSALVTYTGSKDEIGVA